MSSIDKIDFASEYKSLLKKSSFGNSCRKYENAPPNMTSLPIVALTPTKNGRKPPLRNISEATV